MRLFDMHCDTLYRAYTEKSTLFDDSFHISFNKTDGIDTYIQCLAVWIPDEYRGDAAWELFCGCVELLGSQISGTDIKWLKSADDIRALARSGGRGIILTVEGGAVLGGRPERLQQLYDMGVRMMTLTWNGTNELGDGIMSETDGGLTPFGQDVVMEMRRLGMIVDVSHAGEKMFFDTAKLSEKPFAASHSNARALTDHPRNLTDSQIETLSCAGGITGLNFCEYFLNKNKTNASKYDIIKHAGYLMQKGGPQMVGMGADFDGADIPSDIVGIASMPGLYELFEDEFGKAAADAVFFDNAYRFFTENLK